MDFTLRLIEPADAPALHRFFDENFLFLSQWVSGMDRPVSDESSKLFTEEAVNDANNFTAIRLLVMVDSEIAGIVSLIKIDQLHGTAELGFILGEKFTG
ncbi:MAG: GNAT family N-acetyltransferase [Armatimonadota bacterium]